MARISDEVIAEVRAVPIVDVAIALGAHPKRVGKQYLLHCPNPNHSEDTPHTYIEGNKNLFKCFGGGGCGAGGNNAISYYMWHTFGNTDKKNFLSAVKGVAELMGIPIVYTDGRTETAKVKRTYTPIVQQEELPAQSEVVCDKVYRAFLNLCPIRKEHAIEWMQTRQYSKDDIVTLGFRSTPNAQEWVNILSQLLSKGYPLERVPGFVQRFIPDSYQMPMPLELMERDDERNGYWAWSLSCGVGYFIPVRDRMGRIVRLRVRCDQGKAKYIWFSSTHNIDVEKNPLQMKRNGASSGAPVNVVPPTSQIRVWEVGTGIEDIFNVSIVIGTEGEHKSIISANEIKAAVVGVPGVGNFKDVLPLLQQWGTKRFIIAYDMDSLKKDDDSVKSEKKQKNIFAKLQEFAQEVAALGIEVLLWTWDIKDGKGLDDLLQAKKLPMEVNLRTGSRKLVNLNELYIA
ncbi:CHC2 zinc finger domain-containing protein [Peribacillus asahii]|uniref:CHC2 zinc finger domain-containing protein n=1 Tax=Peribacillus asahii TaxID=228899 RepID=UPI00207A6A37|nr:CHC2 zinc finger domain-containing protein [Peribacillus asahii]USK62260.1 CHC2 zinc finger domain-containing protein [Peribacillus asahii]